MYSLSSHQDIFDRKKFKSGVFLSFEDAIFKVQQKLQVKLKWSKK